MYLTVLEKNITYDRTIWFNGNVKQKLKVMQIQRAPLLNITKCYHTGASESLCVLAGCLPIDLVLSMNTDFEKAIIRKENQDGLIDFNSRNLFFKLDDLDSNFKLFDTNVYLQDYKIITDESKINNLVAAAYIIYDSNNIEN